MRRLNLKKTRVKIRILFGILFTHKHYFIVHIDNKSIVDLITGKDIEIGIQYYGLQDYNVHQLIRIIQNNVDDADMLLKKVAFEAEAEILKNKNNP